MQKTLNEIKNGLIETIEEISWVVESGDAHDLQDACDMAHSSMADALVCIQHLELEKTALLKIIKRAGVACGHCKWFNEETRWCDAPDVHTALYDCNDCPFDWIGITED